MANTDIIGTMAVPYSPIINPVLKWDISKKMMDGVLGIDHHREFPTYAKETFESWYKKNVKAFQDTFKHHVSFFHGCYVNYNYPQLGKDLISVMNALGYGVHPRTAFA